MRQLILPIAAMGAIVGLSNYLVQLIINDWLTWSAFSYPLCFLVTDLSNRYLGPAKARSIVLCGFVLGILLSLALSSPRIAIASATAFFVSQMLDIAVFDRLRTQTWWRAPLISSAMGSAFDTLIFFSLAFAFTQTPWVGWAMGDFAVKALMFLSLVPVYRLVCGWLQDRGAIAV